MGYKARNKEYRDMKEFIKILFCFFFGALFVTIVMFAWVGFESVCM